MRIRRYAPDDLEPMLGLWRAVKTATYDFLPTEQNRPIEQDRAYLRDVIAASHEIWLAEDDGEPVGFLAIADGHVDRLYVAVDRQRQGIGTLLLDKARELSPSGLRLFACLGKDVMVVGVGDLVEIWDQAAWGRYSERADDLYAELDEDDTTVGEEGF